MPRKSISASELPPLPDIPAVELWRIVEIKEASEHSSLSVRSLKRHYAHLLIELGPRRLGMRLGHALMIGRRCTEKTKVPA
jgi:hypothetical protein